MYDYSFQRNFPLYTKKKKKEKKKKNSRAKTLEKGLGMRNHPAPHFEKDEKFPFYSKEYIVKEYRYNI